MTDKPMPDWQRRVRDEYRELEERRQKLATFINEAGGQYQSLGEWDRTALFLQLNYMNGYADVLRARIERFDLPVDDAVGVG